MKTSTTNSFKDNVASAVLLAATFATLVGGIVASSAAQAANTKSDVQKMETIVVTASRIEQIARLDTIVVTASRHVEVAPKFMVASK
jgi:hypothetical protein